MYESLLSRDNFYFLEVSALCNRQPVTCTAACSVVEVAEIMRLHNISGIVVVEDGKPVGIVSLRDLRNLVATRLEEIAGIRVREIMQTSLVTIGVRDHLFKAIFKMAKHNIHRLAVLDDDGSLAGVITNSDLLRAQSRCPLYLSQEIESAEDFEQLKTTGRRLFELLQFLVRTGADIQSLISLISHFNDLMSMQVITLLGQLENITLPRSAAFLVLGSEGREEQTLRTDQDNAIVYADTASPEELKQIRLFADRMNDRLEFIGVPRCPGGIMASNRQWRHGLSAWQRILSRWISTPTPKNMVRFGMFQDMRVIHGNLSLGRKLKDHILNAAGSNPLFFSCMAHNIVQFSPPLGLFGGIKLEQKGEHKGMLDLKKGGIFAITQGISLLALMHGNTGGTTWEKIEELKKTSHISGDDLDRVSEAFSMLIKFRLMIQLHDIESGREPGNHCDVKHLSNREQEHLKTALKDVNLLLQILKDVFRLDLLRI